MKGQTIRLYGPSQRSFAKKRDRVKLCILCCSPFEKPGSDSWDYFLNRRMFCSETCQVHAHRIGSGLKREPIQVVFEKWFDKTDGCWEWKGAKDRDGYGVFTYARKNYKPHRLALQFSGVPIPDGHYACHKCNNPSCVNPEHLYAGTPIENSLDKLKAGTQTRGESSPASKLKEFQVREILSTPKKDAHYAEKFGVSKSLITMIRLRKIWKHVEVRNAGV